MDCLLSSFVRIWLQSVGHPFQTFPCTLPPFVTFQGSCPMFREGIYINFMKFEITLLNYIIYFTPYIILTNSILIQSHKLCYGGGLKKKIYYFY